MTSKEIRQKFLDYFESKGHQVVPSSSLLPDDPSVLLTSAGMQQFKPYFLGQPSPYGHRVASCQKSFRTSDIEEVGQTSRHLTFFEMLGNFSFGYPQAEKSYFKKEAIELAWELLVDEYQLPTEKLWVTIFKGEKDISRDEESYQLWQEKGFPKEKILEFGRQDNFWGPTGQAGPCGPTTEIHYDLTGQACQKKEKCLPNCQCGRFIELWNLVFNEYYQDSSGQLTPLEQKGVDTGLGLERLAMVRQEKKNIFEIDLFVPIIEQLRKSASQSNQKPACRQARLEQIIADHIKGSVFLMADGILPSNIEQGYILRRLLRRAIRFGKVLDCPQNFLIPLAQKVIELYGDIYPELESKQADILTGIQNEEEKFSQTLEKGLKEFDKIVSQLSEANRIISGEEAFNLFATYGFPLELTKELAQEKELKVDEPGFQKAFKRHQEISRAGLEKKFGGHGLGEARIFSPEDEEKIKKLHTATHLCHQALRDVLGEQVKQMGSDINPERLRFDFSHHQKMTPEQIKRVEEIVNQKIKENLPVTMTEMTPEQAIKSGALAFFKEKYGQQVKVYSIGDYSKEICAGPHVQRTGQLGKFKITKEQSSSAGVRRIKAVLD